MDQKRLKPSQFNRKAKWVLRGLFAVLLLGMLGFMRLSTHGVDVDTFKLRGVLRYRPRGTHTEALWASAEHAKARMPKDDTYAHFTAQQLQQQLPIRIISLARSTDRRADILKTIQQAGVHNYKFVDAVDALNKSIPDSHVRKFVSGARYGLWKRGHIFHRGKVAVDLSHYQELERIAAENKPAIIVEDDAAFPNSKDWYAGLLSRLQELPEDWDVLYLAGCYVTEGQQIGKHLVVVRNTACTLGYVATPSFANMVLLAVRRANRLGITPVVDLLIANLIQHQELNAYMSRPFLVNFTKYASNSTIAYAAQQPEKLTLWEKFWTSTAGKRR